MWSTNETHEKDFAQREQATSSPKPKEPVAKGSVVRLPEPSVTPFKRTVLAWVGINNRFSAMAEFWRFLELSDLKELMV